MYTRPLEVPDTSYLRAVTFLFEQKKSQLSFGASRKWAPVHSPKSVHDTPPARQGTNDVTVGLDLTTATQLDDSAFYNHSIVITQTGLRDHHQTHKK